MIIRKKISRKKLRQEKLLANLHACQYMWERDPCILTANKLMKAKRKLN